MITITPDELRKIMILFQDSPHLVIQLLLVFYGLRKGFTFLKSERNYIQICKKIEYCIQHHFPSLRIHTFIDGILITRCTELPTGSIQEWIDSPFINEVSSNYYAIETTYGKPILFHYGYDRDWFEWCNYVVEFIYFVTYQWIPLRIKQI